MEVLRERVSSSQVDVVRCSGDLSAAEMVQVKNKVNRLINKHHYKLVLDVSQAKRVDLAGLGILIERLQKIRALNGDIKLCHLRPQISEVFRLVGISQLIETFDSAEEALRSF